MFLTSGYTVEVRKLLHLSDMGSHSVYTSIQHSSSHLGPHRGPGAAARLDSGGLR